MRELAGGGRMQDYLRAVASRDAVAVQSLTTRLLDDGMDPVTVLTDLIAAVQRDNGQRWQRGEWTIAEEHAATAMAVAATTAVSRYVRRTAPTRGRVLVACTEREWHALPAMIIDCTLRSDGWDSVLMGAATSPARLNQYLQDHGPEAVAVSCSMLGSLPATRRFIEASTAAGVPIVVGGPAFGVDDVRAKALGATAWAADAQGALAAVADLPAVVPPAMPLPADAMAEQADLEHDHRLIVAGLAADWSVTARALPDRADTEVAVDALNHLLHAVSAVLLTGDSRPVPETATWIAEVVTTRGFDAAVIAELADKSSAALRTYPLARDIIDTHFADAL